MKPYEMYSRELMIDDFLTPEPDSWRQLPDSVCFGTQE